MPDPARAAAALALLRDLGLTDAEVPRVVKVSGAAVGRGSPGERGRAAGREQRGSGWGRGPESSLAAAGPAPAAPCSPAAPLSCTPSPPAHSHTPPRVRQLVAQPAPRTLQHLTRATRHHTSVTRRQAFPELLGCTQDALRANVAKLRSDWKLDGRVLAGAVARQPAVLGYTLDCGGDCAGECNRCWARF